MSYKIALTWTDKQGKPFRKEYTNERDAIKARNWLEANGAATTDLAVVINHDKIEPRS